MNLLKKCAIIYAPNFFLKKTPKGFNTFEGIFHNLFFTSGFVSAS